MQPVKSRYPEDRVKTLAEQYEENDLKERIAYMALFKELIEDGSWLPSDNYYLVNLIARGHVDIHGAFVRLNQHGAIWWLLLVATITPQPFHYSQIQRRLRNRFSR